MNDFDSKLNSFFNKLDTAVKQYVPNMIAETAREHYQNALISKSWNGIPYKPYGNLKREPRRGSLMMRTNNLFRSIEIKEVTPNRVIMSAGNSRVKYARIHNEGGRVAGTQQIAQFTNRNFMGKGKAVQIKAHSRTVNYMMPQRQFMGKNPKLLNEIKERFKNEIRAQLR